MAVASEQARVELVKRQNHWLESHLGHLWSPLPSSNSTLDVEACDTQWIEKTVKTHPGGRHIACGSLLNTTTSTTTTNNNTSDSQGENTDYHPLPPGCVAIKADIRQGLSLADHQFDYIRFCVPLLWSEYRPTNWAQVIAELCRVARPGARLDLFLPPNLIPLDLPAGHQLRGWLKRLHCPDDSDTSIIIPADHINTALRQHCNSVQQSVIAIPMNTSSPSVGLACSRQAWQQLRERILTLPEVTESQLDTAIEEYHEAIQKSGSKMFISVWRATTLPRLSSSSGHRSSSSCSSMNEHPSPPKSIPMTSHRRSLSVDQVQSESAVPVRLRNKVLSSPSQWRHTLFGGASSPEEINAASINTATSPSILAQARRRSVIYNRPHSMIAATATTATPTHQRRISVAHTFSQFVGTLKKQRTIRRRQTVMGFGRHVHDADTLHVAMMTALHGTHAAILQQPRRILNVATGTGVWIKDTANKYPMTEFTGIDLIEQHFDTHTPLASNCILAKGNIVQGLPYPNTYFDYIYQRDMALDVANAEIEWLSAFKEMYRMLLPGGLIEIIECDLQITGKSQASRKLNGLITTAAARHKLGVGRVATIDRRLVSTGFHDITRTIRQLRMGKWAGLEGICAKRYYRARVEQLFPFIQTLGVTVEELNAMLQELEEECDTKHHVHLQLYCYLAYRPSDENGNNSSHIDMESSTSSIITSNAVVLSSSSKLRPPAEVLTKRVRKGFQVLRNSWSWPRSGTAPHHILSSLAVHHQRVYLIPRCTEELERLDSQHNMLLHFLGTLCMAPITQPKRVLDLGTGTGGWVKSMAEEYPFCEIHGCDNDEEIMPTASISPQCSFQYGDIMKGLPYPDGYFDYVYQRQMLLAFPTTNDGWPTIGLEWQRILSHGGHIELVETDHLLRSIGPQGDQLNDWFKRLCEHHAIQVDMPQTLRSILRKSKFERVRDQTLPCPLGEWGGRIGNTHQQTYRQFILGLAMHFTAIGVTRIMLEQALDALEKETEQTKGFINIYIAWGRKPSPKPESTPSSASKEDKPLPQLPAQMVE